MVVSKLYVRCLVGRSNGCAKFEFNDIISKDYLDKYLTNE